MRRERGEEMEMMLLAARPREIEREIEYADGTLMPLILYDER